MQSLLRCIGVLLFSAAVLDGKKFRGDYKYVSAIQGWLKYQEMPADWKEARLRCHMEGAYLASPLTDAMKTEMLSELMKQKLVTPIFTGIHATFSKGDFTSVEGIPLYKIPHVWSKHEPDNFRNEEDALVMLPDGTLGDVRSVDAYPYFCYKKKANLVVSSCGTTDSEYTLDARTGQCYKFHKVPRTWSRAYMTCMAEGGYLTVINSDTEATIIRELFAKNPAGSMLGTFWKDVAFVGFHDWGEHGEWRTVQGQTLNEAGYSKFSPGEPNNSTTGEFCGAVYRTALFDDLWCENRYAFICEKDPGSLISEKKFRHDYKYVSAIQGWLKYQEIPANWKDARLRCHMEGATLASPLTAALKTAMLAELAERQLHSTVFTGIHATFSRGDYTSVEGVFLSQIPVTWARNEPDNFKDEENALVMFPDGTMGDASSQDTFSYFCYKKKATLVVNGCGTTDPEYNLDTRTGQCYKFHRVPRTWSRAYMNCIAEGGYLTIINSETEATVIKELFAKNPGGLMLGNFWKDVAFVGFHDWGEHGEWRTIHGQTLTEAGYSKFSGGEPNNATTGEYCGAVYRTALYDDLWCENRYAFICEKDPASLACEDDDDEDK